MILPDPAWGYLPIFICNCGQLPVDSLGKHYYKSCSSPIWHLNTVIVW